jgi:hypothetical protein
MVPGTPRAVGRREAEAIAEASPIPVVGVFPQREGDGGRLAARRFGLTRSSSTARRTRPISGASQPASAEIEIWAAAAVGATCPSRALGADRTLFDTKSAGARAAPAPPSTGAGCAAAAICPAASRRRPRPRQSPPPPGGSAPSRSTSARASRAAPGRKDQASSPPSSRRFGRRLATVLASC